jgi:diguanylate cyclase (GGDEF)-like protein
MPKNNRKTRDRTKYIKPTVNAVIAFFITAAICSFVIGAIILYKINIESLTMEQFIFEKSTKASAVISKLLYKTHILAAILDHNNGEIENFEQSAAAIIDDKAIRNVLIAPSGVVSKVYPLQGNENLVGLNFFTESPGGKEAVQARDQGELVLGGPFTSAQGERILIGCLPVLSYTPERGSRFWGLVSITLDFRRILDEIGLHSPAAGFSYELLKVNPDNGEKEIIAEGGYTGTTRVRFIERHVNLFNADWYFRIGTALVWYESTENWEMIIVGLFISVLIAFIIQKGSELKKISKELEHMAHTDPLTGVFNRRYFEKVTSAHLSRMKTTNERGYVIMFDLDHFKKINDTYGHAAGDKVLRIVPERVRACVRPYDLFARYGGEEFILFIAPIDEAGICALAERCRSCIACKPIDYEGYTIEVTSSFGIAEVIPEDGLHAAVTFADEALYRAKQGGRNRFAVHHAGSESSAAGPAGGSQS